MLGPTHTHVSLLARLRDGAAGEAWVEFCDRYGELIRSFARRQGVQPADCDDVLQEVLLALTKALPGFHYDPQKGRFRAYLKTATLRAIARRGRRTGPASIDDLPSGLVPGEDDGVAAAHWEDEWRQYHLRRAMQAITHQFGESDRTAFQLYAVAGREAASVATELGLSIDQVYQAKSRLLRRLGELVAAQVEEEG